MDDVGDVVELEVGDGVEVDGVDVGVLVDDDEGVGVELLCELVSVDVGEDRVEDEGVEVDGVDVGVLVEDDEGVELLCELALSIVLIALLRNRV